jgi:hypothetical protein
MFCAKSFSSLFSSPNFVLIWIASANSKISMIDFLSVGRRRLHEEEGKDNQTNHVHIFGQAQFAGEAAVGRNPCWLFAKPTRGHR